MRIRTALLSFVVCLLVVVVYAADNPAVGTWKLNEGKSKIVAGSPKNTTVVYAPDGDNYKLTTDGVNGNGDAAHSEWVGKFDGKDYPVTGDPAVDVRSFKQVNPRKLELTNKKDGKATTTGTIEMSADGKSRTLKTHGTMANGKKVDNTFVYDKQ